MSSYSGLITTHSLGRSGQLGYNYSCLCSMRSASWSPGQPFSWDCLSHCLSGCILHPPKFTLCTHILHLLLPLPCPRKCPATIPEKWLRALQDTSICFPRPIQIGKNRPNSWFFGEVVCGRYTPNEPSHPNSLRAPDHGILRTPNSEFMTTLPRRGSQPLLHAGIIYRTLKNIESWVQLQRF